MELVIALDGTVRCIYDEKLDMTSLGPLQIERASQVEPDAGGRWIANLAPVGGPQLGPFSRRSEALTAEVSWLAAHWLTSTDVSSASRTCRSHFNQITQPTPEETNPNRNE